MLPNNCFLSKPVCSIQRAKSQTVLQAADGNPYWSPAIKYPLCHLPISILSPSCCTQANSRLLCFWRSQSLSIHAISLPPLDRGYLVSPRPTRGACWVCDAVWYLLSVPCRRWKVNQIENTLPVSCIFQMSSGLYYIFWRLPDSLRDKGKLERLLCSDRRCY